MPKYKDETGNKYGKLTVLYQIDNPKKNGAMWHCQCECGNYRDVLGKRLRSGEAKECNKCAANHFKGEDLTGQKFNRLTVLNEHQYKNKKTYWKCRCDCGTEVWVWSGNLKNGEVKSCGCMRFDLTPKQDLIGKRFGKLVVLNLSHRSQKDKQLYWKCKCDCGNIKYVSTRNLTTGKTKSCGCLRQSPGERRIIQLLTEYKLPFEYEYKFDDFRNTTSGHYYRFDFYVNNKYCIEFDGRQHWGGAGWKNYSLEQLQKNDKLKNEYCKEHNIPLIRIPYNYENQITIDDLCPETSQFLVT